MSFISGVWRLLGADNGQGDESSIMEHPAVSDRVVERYEAGEDERELLEFPEDVETTMFVFRPELGEDDNPVYSLKRYAGFLMTRRAVILDINELVDKDVEKATRIVDYLSGVVEAVDGTVWEITRNIFIFAPSNVQLAGDPLTRIEVI